MLGWVRVSRASSLFTLTLIRLFISLIIFRIYLLPLIYQFHYLLIHLFTALTQNVVV